MASSSQALLASGFSSAQDIHALAQALNANGVTLEELNQRTIQSYRENNEPLIEEKKDVYFKRDVSRTIQRLETGGVPRSYLDADIPQRVINDYCLLRTEEYFELLSKAAKQEGFNFTEAEKTISAQVAENHPFEELTHELFQGMPAGFYTPPSERVQRLRNRHAQNVFNQLDQFQQMIKRLHLPPCEDLPTPQKTKGKKGKGRRDSIDDLMKELELYETKKQPKKRKQKAAQSNHHHEAPKQTAPAKSCYQEEQKATPLLQPLGDKIKQLTSPFFVHSRVTEDWRSLDPNVLRERVGSRYPKDVTDEKLLEQRYRHRLIEAVKVYVWEKRRYAFKTNTGFGMAVSLFVPEKNVQHGFLYFGVDQKKNRIYHCYLEVKTIEQLVHATKKEITNIKKENIEEKDAKDGSWTEVEHASLNKIEVSDKGEVTLHYSEREGSHQLLITPL